MKALKQNVQLLNIKSVHNSIQSFFNEKGDSSSHTRVAYEKDIKNFFSIMLGKELSQLTANDLTFDKTDIISYRTHLKGLKKEDETPKYKNSSINRFIDSVKSLFIELDANGYEEYIHLNAFHFDKLPEKDTKGAGDITEDEFAQMQETALTLENGLMKSYLIGLAGRTSIRLSALLGLRWSDITYINEGQYKGMWEVNVFDKGNKEDTKPVMDCYYQSLLSIRVDGQNKLFNISDTAVNNMIKRVCKLMGIPDDRNITFHSLKGYGINVVIYNGGSMEDAKRQGNHADIGTTSKRYIAKTRDYSKYAGVIIDSPLDTSPLDSLDKDQLLALINGTDKNIQRLIMNAYYEGKGR